MIGCDSVMNWNGITVFYKIRFYVGRDGAIGCKVMNEKDDGKV